MSKNEMHFSNRAELFDALVKERGWSKQTMYVDRRELQWANEKTSREEALDFITSYRQKLCRSVAAEFQSRHSAMSAQGAQAYCDNWN